MHEARLDLLELSEQKKSSEIEKNMNCEKKKNYAQTGYIRF